MKTSRILFAALLGLSLSACDSSSGGGSTPVQDDQPTSAARSSIAGRVVDAVSKTPLADVTVTVSRTASNGAPGAAVASARTDASGNYRLDNIPDATDYVASFNFGGYKAEQYRNISVRSASAATQESVSTLDSVDLVSDDNAGVGSIAGVISSAVDDQAIAGLTLNFRSGINTVSGDIVASTVTDSNGQYFVEGIEYGNVTCEIAGAGFETAYATVLALGNLLVDQQNTAISPALNAGELRIVLSWGQTPSDLDSHLTGPVEGSTDYFHVFFADSSDSLVNLDTDDTSSFGPETITIERQINGIYRYTVYNFSNGGPTDLAESEARVRVLGENGLVAEFFVPAGTGNLWTVFDLNGSSIMPINTVTERSATGEDHFPPQGRLRSVTNVGGFNQIMPLLK